jgi:glycosyltransferase involved in cell wall biosynthesis
VAKNLTDAKMLNETFSVSPVVLGHRLPPVRGRPGFKERKGLLFVGALYAEDTPNYDSLQWFIQDIFPLFNNTVPGIEFHIVGYQDTMVLEVASDFASQIFWHGLANNLGPFFDASKVFVAPTRYAGGLPHKVENALSNGLPTVCSPLLAQQLDDGSGRTPVLVPSDWAPESFADCVSRLYSDAELWSQFQEMGWQYVTERCDPERHDSTIRELING